MSLNEQNSAKREAPTSLDKSSEHLGDALAKVDAMFTDSLRLSNKGRTEIKQFIQDLGTEKITEMGQDSWQRYSNEAMKKLDDLFVQFGLDPQLQGEVLQVIDHYIDLEVGRGLDQARIGLDLLGQAIDARLKQVQDKTELASVSADLNFGVAQSNFSYNPDKGLLQFNVGAEAAGALLEMSGNTERIDSMRAAMTVNGTRMEFVKLGDLYEVTVRLGEHLSIGSSLDPKGKATPKLQIPFREGSLSLAPKISFPAGSDQMPKLDGLSLSLVDGPNRQLSLSSDNGTGGSIEYQQKLAANDDREDINVSAEVAYDAKKEETKGYAKLELVF